MASKGMILLTGANGGLGSATVEKVLKSPGLASNYMGVYTARKVASADKLQSALRKGPKSHLYETLDLELGSIESVKKFAQEINHRVEKGELPRIRALILNAGFQEHDTLTITDDGYDMSWQVNYLANYILSLLLLQSMDQEHGRILVIGSWTHDPSDPRNDSGGDHPFKDAKWHDIFPGPESLAKGWWSPPEGDPLWFCGFRRYGASKLCAVMHAFELSKRLRNDPKLSKVSVLGLDPGAMASDLGRRGSFMFRFLLGVLNPLVARPMVWWNENAMLRPPWKSAEHVVRACFEVEPPRDHKLYLNGSEPSTASKETRDPVKLKALWQYTREAANIQEGETSLSEWQ